MKIITIKIKKSAVVSEFLSNLKRVGSPDWSIYANQAGDVDTRHVTEPLSGWAEVTDFYSAWDNLENDEETADWLMSKEGFDWARTAQNMEEEFKNDHPVLEDADGELEFQEFEIDFI